MRRGRHLAGAVLCAGAAVVAAVALLAPVSAPASAGALRKRYYVAIGASDTLGYQAGGASGTTLATDEGYTNDLTAMEKARWPGLELVPFACPGLRVDMALDGGRATTLPPSVPKGAATTTTGRCRRTGSEVGRAATFIRTHPGQVALVTLDLGYPDVAACLLGRAVDSACVADALERVRAALPTVVSRLRAAGGSSLTIVGLDHEDPFLAYYLGRSDPDPGFAEASAVVTERFDQVVASVYAHAGVRVARVAAAFATGRTTPARLARWGSVPLEVDRICTLTWMCTKGNIHPNAKGYRRIAAAVAAAIVRT